MKRSNLSSTKPTTIQDDIEKSQNYEKINFKVDASNESDKDEVNIISIDIAKPSKIESNKNYLDLLPNIIKYNNNIKITRINNGSTSSKSHCAEDYSEQECKKLKLVDSIHKEVLQDKSNENFRGVCHLRLSSFQQQRFKSPTILRNSNQVKATIESRSPGEVNSISCQTDKYQILSIYNIRNNEKAIEFYTGLQTYEKFLHVFNSLGSDAYDLRYYYYDQTITLSILDQFFMTLVLLRQHKSHYEMSILFDVTLKDIKNIFITWVRFMKLEWNNIKFPLSYISDVKMTDSAKNVIVLDKDSGIEIDCTSNGSNANDASSKQDRSIPDRSKSFKKVYKILNGPQNYIESHLMNDIVFVCQALCYFKAKRISHKEQSKGYQC